MHVVPSAPPKASTSTSPDTFPRRPRPETNPPEPKRTDPHTRKSRNRLLTVCSSIMRVALAQVNPTVGDLAGNRRIIEEAIGKARSARADLVVFSEMALTGYPPMDLLDRDGFVPDQMRELEALAAASADITVVLGAVVRAPGLKPKEIQNAAVVFFERPTSRNLRQIPAAHL